MGKKIDIEKLRELVDEATFRKIMLEVASLPIRN